MLCRRGTNRAYVCIGVYLNSKLLIMFHSNVLAVQINYNVDYGCVFMFVECMERCRVGPGRTARTFVLVCAFIRRCYSHSEHSIQYEIIILTPMCCPNTLQWWRRLCVYVRGMYGTATDEQNVRLYCCVCVCLNLKPLIVFTVVWSRNRTMMCCSNTLQWR